MALITVGRVAPPEPANATRGATLCMGGVEFMRCASEPVDSRPVEQSSR
jgi:hypothetical protein